MPPADQIVYDPSSEAYELLTLRCACGTGIVGVVLKHRCDDAISPFEAHHQGPKCSPTSACTDTGVGAGRSRSYPRLTPERICARRGG